MNNKINKKNQTRHFLLDEAHLYTNLQNVTLNSKAGQLTFNLIRKIAKEGRKFGNFLILSTQSPYDIDSEIFSQFGNFIVHKLNNAYDLSKIYNYTNIKSNVLSNYIKNFSEGEAMYSSFDFPFVLFLYFPFSDIKILSCTNELKDINE